MSEQVTTRVTDEQLKIVLEKHHKWLNSEEGGERADLTSANLRYANLRFADLRFANLRRANLTSADLTSADLRRANLTSADLTSADLTSADLRFANLRYADLTSADLTSADLTSADLRFANLTSADLTSANLRYANLRFANLDTVRQELILAILHLPDEIPALRKAVIEGRIDGTTYTGQCACLAGTLCNAKNIDFAAFQEQGLMPIDASSPREMWFWRIKPGDTPKNSQLSKITLEWIDEAMALVAKIRGVNQVAVS